MGIRKCIKKSIVAVMRWATTNDYDEKQAIECSPQYGNMIGSSRNTSSLKADHRDTQFTDYPVRLTLHNGRGGRVIVSDKYNPQTDRTDTRMYVIPDTADFTKEIEHIVMMESL